MSFATDIARPNQDPINNIGALVELEKEGHTVEKKGDQAAYVDGYLMIFIYANTYENHRTGERAEFEAGKIKELLGNDDDKKQTV